jgi:protein-disulfide isomerase
MQEDLMRNIWAYVVGGVVTIGAVVTLYSAIEGKSPTAKTRTPAPAAVNQTASVAAPTPDASYDMVEVTKDDYVLGKSDAPVTLIEYASLTCSHCAAFHNNVLPTIKKEYIDTGKVRMVYRDFPLDQMALTGSMLARCAGRDRYYPFIDALFEQQSTWASSNNPLAALSRLARLGGMSQAQFEDCLKKKEIADAVLKQRLEGQQKFAISSTPTVVVNGKKFGGGLTIEQFRAVVDPMLK